MEPLEQIQDILSYYDLGDLVAFEKNERGYVNQSFAIDVLKSGVNIRYFLRQYKRGIKETELRFEHSLINHLVAKKYPRVARVHRTRSGETYVEKVGKTGGGPVYFAIFDYLPGDDRYTWVDPKCTEVEIIRSAEILAQFHSAVCDLAPDGQRAEPGITTLLPTIPEIAQKCLGQSKHTLFDETLKKNLSMVENEIVGIQLALNQPSSQKMPRLVIHCDYHPGNLKFEGEDVVGLFDFDWSKIDFRAFDVGLAIFYFLVSWGRLTDGHLLLSSLSSFLGAYQKECARIQSVPPLDEIELLTLPSMIRAGNLYALNWTLLDYYGKNVDPEEYLKYLQHSLETIKWFAARENTLLVTDKSPG
jgi:homoserine kinase type II